MQGDIQAKILVVLFVLDGPFARKEMEALWMGYKKKELNAQLLHTMVE